MPRGFDLRREAQVFADELSGVLNGTVCDGIRLSCALDRGTGVVIIGFRPSRNDIGRVRGIPLCLTGRPTLYLGLSMRLQPDRFNAYLMVLTSGMILACDEDLNDTCGIGDS